MLTAVIICKILPEKLLFDNVNAKILAQALGDSHAAVGILILDAAVKMLQKMQKKPVPRAFMLCAFAAMMLINAFSVRISSMFPMLAAGLISLIIFVVKKPAAEGGAVK